VSPFPVGSATDGSLSGFSYKDRSDALKCCSYVNMTWSRDELRRAYLLLSILFTALLCLSGIAVAAADPQKNQIEVKATCPPPNGQEYTFVINGMSKTGDVKASTSNVVVKKYTVTYYEVIGTLDDPPGKGDDIQKGSDTFEFGNKKVLENGDLISCSGVAANINILLEGQPVLVTAIYDFQAFVTPKSGA
jgi:hypothetical protein